MAKVKSDFFMMDKWLGPVGPQEKQVQPMNHTHRQEPSSISVCTIYFIKNTNEKP